MLFLVNPLLAIPALILSLSLGFFLSDTFLYKYYFVLPLFLIGFILASIYQQYRFKKYSYMFNWKKDKLPSIFFLILFGFFFVDLLLNDFYVSDLEKTYFNYLWIIPLYLGFNTGNSHTQKNINAQVLFTQNLNKTMKLHSIADDVATPEEFNFIKHSGKLFFCYEAIFMLPMFILLPALFLGPFFYGILHHEEIKNALGSWYLYLAIMMIVYAIGSAVLMGLLDLFKEYLLKKMFPKFKGSFKDYQEITEKFKFYFGAQDSAVRTTRILNGEGKDWVDCF